MTPLFTLLALLAGQAPSVVPGQGAGALVLLAGGDVTLGYHLPEYLDELAGGGAPREQLWDYPFHRLADVTRTADLFLINLEGGLGEGGEPLEKSFRFKAPPEYVEVLLSAGVDVVSLANNHSFDYGEPGLTQTLATLQRAGIAAFGAGRNLAEARRPAVLERRGLRVGFLGYLYMGEHTVEPEAMYAGPDRPGVAGTHKDEATLRRWLDEDVRSLRPLVDIVVVSFHWGREGTPLLEPYQRPLAAAAIAAGADLVVGHHAHSVQGVEPMGQGWVAYGLGNLVFGGNWSPRFKEAALLRSTWRTGPGRSRVPEISILPIRIDGMPAGEPFQPRWLADDAACALRRQMQCWPAAGALEDCLPAVAAEDAAAAVAGDRP